MTIETATPSSLETLAGMFDTLVDLIVNRVAAKLDERITNKIEEFVADELDGKIDEWASNFLQDRVSEHVTLDGSMLDIHDEVLEIVQEMSFDIRVSR